MGGVGHRSLPVADFSASSNVKCRAREAEGTETKKGLTRQREFCTNH
jgi:hypothetical protein